MNEEDRERADAQEPACEPGAASVARRLNRAFGPIVAGMLIDLVDVATFGPIGFVLGVPVGGLAGYWMGRCLGLSRRASFYCALAAGVYATIPGTEMIPLATMVGAYARFRESAREPAPETDGAPDNNRL